DYNFVDRLEIQAIRLCYQRDFPRWVQVLLMELVYINIFWPIFNLLPVWPLDGGQVSREVWTKFAPRNGVRFSLIMSVIVCAIFPLNSLSGLNGGPSIPYVPAGGMFMVIFFAILAINNFLELQFLSRQRASGFRTHDDDDADRMPWERDADWW